MVDGILVRPLRGAMVLVALMIAGASAAHAQSTGNSTGLRVLQQEPDYVDLGVGAFNAISPHSSSATSPQARIEYRDGTKLFSYLGPTVGLLFNTRGGVYGFGGFYADIAYDQFRLTPLAAIGGYRRGNSEDLGGIFQFRLSLTGSYQLENRSRIGVELGHISNAGTHSKNPGENDIMLTYGLPLSDLF